MIDLKVSRQYSQAMDAAYRTTKFIIIGQGSGLCPLAYKNHVYLILKLKSIALDALVRSGVGPSLYVIAS